MKLLHASEHFDGFECVRILLFGPVCGQFGFFDLAGIYKSALNFTLNFIQLIQLNIIITIIISSTHDKTESK